MFEFCIFFNSDFFHTQTHRYIHNSLVSHTHTCMHTYMHAHTHAPTHPSTHSHIHAHILLLIILTLWKFARILNLLNHPLLLPPLALQPFVDFGFLSQVIPSHFFPIFHISPSYHYTYHPAILVLVFLSVSNPTDFHSNILFTIHEQSILWMWPNHLILWALINLTMPAPLIKQSRSTLLRILQAFSPVRCG